MLSKTLALAIAIVLFVELLRDKRPRYLVSLCAGCWMLVLLLLTHPPAVLEALSLHSFLTPRFWFAHGGVTELNVGINWSTMFFLTGMMVLVEGMGEAGFFDWVSLRLARALGFRPMAILLRFMILAALLAMFVANFLAEYLNNRYGRFLRSIIFIPTLVSYVAAATVWEII